MSAVELSLLGRLARRLVPPVVRMLVTLKGALERLAGRLGNIPPSEMLEEELESVIIRGMAEGAMERGEGELIQSVIEFGDTLVREVMVPRIDVRAFEANTPLPEVLEAVGRLGHTRWPVYRESIDHIIGILHAKDLVTVWKAGNREAPIESLLRPAIHVPENQRISILLREFKKRRTHLAIVLDEFGGTAGLVTLEDLVEEIIGEVADEFDRGEHQTILEVEGGWVADSRTSLDRIGERLGIPAEELEKHESETIGGLMSELLGRLPRAGDETPFAGWVLRVAATDGRRILRIHLRRSA